MNWNQETITQWAVSTFGKPATLQGVMEKLHGEMSELYEEVVDANGEPARIGKECADVFIVLVQIAEHSGVNLMEEVAKKMAINAAREWKIIGDGIAQHI